MNKFYKYIVCAAVAVLLSMGLNSCVKDLDVEPIDPALQSDVTPEQLFNKCYANLAVQGNGGSDGDCDIDGIDGGFSVLYRMLWNANELTTDEAMCKWGDPGIEPLNKNGYDASNPFLEGLYYRLYTGIAFCNQYLTAFGDYNKTMTAEIRFLRAFQFYILMDCFGNVPFTPEVSGGKADQISRADLFNFVEEELLEIEPLMSEPKAKKSSDEGYGRADKAACWMVLARIYLNSQVYTGTAQWTKAAEYAKKVMDSDYKILERSKGNETWSAYQMLFMGDNGETDAAYEAILPILYDGLRTTSWGGSLFLMASTYDANMHGNPNDPIATNGVSGQNWEGNRARPQLVNKFFNGIEAPVGEAYAVAKAAGDDRALFNTVDRIIDIIDNNTFQNGFAVGKFNNFKTDGSAGHHATHPDADIFLIRKAEAYLTYAEALTRAQGSGAAPAEAVTAINVIRSRAGANVKASYNLNDILDEWSREFYFEGRRRIDLIRFGKFGGTTDYKWQWKGGDFNGRDFPEFRNIFPIPYKDITANEKLKQNPGY